MACPTIQTTSDQSMEDGRLARPKSEGPFHYEGMGTPGHAFGRVARITASNSLLSAGF